MEMKLSKGSTSALFRKLVRDVSSSEEEIRPLYEGVLKEFKSEARINTFLSILVSKKVKELLRAREGNRRSEGRCARGN